jgi:hypothetical protein
MWSSFKSFMKAYWKAFAIVGGITILVLIGLHFHILLIKVFSIPIFWVLNGLGYFVSAAAIRRGYGADVVSHRLLTFVLFVGIVIGYVVGNLVPLR